MLPCWMSCVQNQTHRQIYDALSQVAWLFIWSKVSLSKIRIILAYVLFLLWIGMQVLSQTFSSVVQYQVLDLSLGSCFASLPRHYSPPQAFALEYVVRGVRGWYAALHVQSSYLHCVHDQMGLRNVSELLIRIFGCSFTSTHLHLIRSSMQYLAHDFQ